MGTIRGVELRRAGRLLCGDETSVEIHVSSSVGDRQLDRIPGISRMVDGQVGAEG